MLNIMFPEICSGCKKILYGHETLLCTECRHKLPLVCHHKTNDEGMKQVFYGRFPVENATALLQFNKRGITQEILHNLKYRGQEKLSGFFGEWLGAELKEIQTYKSIDIVIAVPLHKQKLKTRGYNQVAGFAKAIADHLDIMYCDDVLFKLAPTASQVFKGRLTRLQNEGTFSIKNSEKILEKHILLVDDIVTTGATLETCALQLLNNGAAKLSIATMAIA